MNLARSIALALSPDLRSIARDVEEADRLVRRSMETPNYEEAAEKIQRASDILNGVHHRLTGHVLPGHNRG